MPRVVHFEIHAENPERAIAFYSTLFGWKFDKWEGPQPYWLITTGKDGEPGINGGLLKRHGPSPLPGQAVNAYGCTVEVPSLDTYLKSATDKGAQVALPKMAIPGVGWLAYCIDTEGNIFGITQFDPAAM